MTYLDLCRRACIDCGVSPNAAIPTVLPTVVGATGSIGRVVNWVGDALSDIMMLHDDWDFMRSSNILGAGVSFQTVAGQASYSLGTGPGTVGVLDDNFGKWDRDTFRSYTTSVGVNDETFLGDIDYDVWRNSYMLGANRNEKTRPAAIAIGPNKSLNLGPPPNALYTITGDYFVAPIDMVADADVPVGLPTRFHILCVYLAMMKYGQYEAAPEVYARGKEESAGMYAQLEARYAPEISFGGALA